jgi:hypothetical protein
MAKSIKLLTNLLNLPPRKIITPIVAFLALTVMFGALLGYNLKTRANQQFVYLADSLARERLDFQEEHQRFLTQEVGGKSIWTDTAEFAGKKYWPLGPFPAVLLLPFAFIFGTNFLQGYISFALTLLNFYLLYQIAKKLGLEKVSAAWLASFFIFGSVYLGVAAFSVSWYFAQVVAVTLLLLALFEYLRPVEVRPPTEVGPPKIRWWLIGAYLAAAMLTRSNLILASLFFILMIVKDNCPRDKKIKNLSHFSSLILASVFLLLLYNWARFGNPLESGYNLQDIAPAHAAARAVGLFSLRHIPGNLFFLLFRGPNPVLASPTSYILKWPYITANIWGVGIFFTSPIFLYLFAAPWRDKLVRAATYASLLLLFSIVTYYGIGAVQVGYRYALDFLPFLYVILCKGLAPKLPLKAKILIVLGIILNWHLLLQFRS